jgi:hypothetical protein
MQTKIQTRTDTQGLNILIQKFNNNKSLFTNCRIIFKQLNTKK